MKLCWSACARNVARNECIVVGLGVMDALGTVVEHEVEKDIKLL